MSSEKRVPAYIAGLNQSKKQLKKGKVRTACVASDAERRIFEEMTELCDACGVALDTTRTKSELGELCGIEVDCAVCVILN